MEKKRQLVALAAVRQRGFVLDIFGLREEEERRRRIKNEEERRSVPFVNPNPFFPKLRQMFNPKLCFNMLA